MKDCQNDNNIVGNLHLEQVKATMQTGVQVKHVTTRDRVKPTTPLFVKPGLFFAAGAGCLAALALELSQFDGTCAHILFSSRPTADADVYAYLS
jgi:hypothetical protein